MKHIENTRNFEIVGKKAEKTRWDACVELGQLTGKPTIQVSTLLKGLKLNEVEGFISQAKTYSRPDIQFWQIWKENKPK